MEVNDEVDDVEMFDPKAAVLEMLKKTTEETWSESLEWDGDVRVQEEAPKDQKEIGPLTNKEDEVKNRDRTSETTNDGKGRGGLEVSRGKLS